MYNLRMQNILKNGGIGSHSGQSHVSLVKRPDLPSDIIINPAILTM